MRRSRKRLSLKEENPSPPILLPGVTMVMDWFLVWSHERNHIVFTVPTDLLRLLPGAASAGLGTIRRPGHPDIHGSGAGVRSAAQTDPLAALRDFSASEAP